MTDAAGPRSVAVLTTGRQDWGILRSTSAAIKERPDLRLKLIVGGMHLVERYGRTVDLIRADGFEPTVELNWLAGAVEPSATAQAGAALALVGECLDADPPDALVLVGDRFETTAAAVAATIARVPLVHLHGGEQTLGAFDDSLRHAITKLSHLHLVSHDEHARRVAAMGEDPRTVHVVGAPGLDNAFRADLADRMELERRLGIELAPPVIIVTVHPETLQPDPAAIGQAVGAAMDQVEATYVVTLPNADPGGEALRRTLVQAAARPGRVAVEALGDRLYWGLMRAADAMLGNSSSGIVEAPALDLPVVNVGDRQLGRRREANVIDVPADPGSIADAVRRALEPATQAEIRQRHPALMDGQAGTRVTDIIARWRPPNPPRKAPIDVPA